MSRSITILNDYPTHVGITEYALDLLRNLRNHDFNVKFVQWVPTGLAAAYPGSETVIQSKLSPMRHSAEIGFILGENWRALRGVDGDIIHATSPSLARLARHFGRRFVVTLHDVCYLSQFGNSKIMSLYYLRRYYSLDPGMNIVCDSTNTRRQAIERLRVSPQKTRVVYNSVDTSIFRPIAPGELAAKLGEEDDFLLLHVGYDAPTKNLQVLLRALARLPKRFKLVRVGGFAVQSRRLARRLGVSSRVIHLSNLTSLDLRRVYWGTHALVYPSTCEGFGRPVVEAMACGTPVVASNLSCLPEIVGNAGMLVDVSDEWELVRAITSLSEGGVASGLRERGLTRVQAFSPKIQFNQLLRAYESFNL